MVAISPPVPKQFQGGNKNQIRHHLLFLGLLYGPTGGPPPVPPPCLRCPPRGEVARKAHLKPLQFVLSVRAEGASNVLGGVLNEGKKKKGGGGSSIFVEFIRQQHT